MQPWENGLTHGVEAEEDVGWQPSVRTSAAILLSWCYRLQVASLKNCCTSSHVCLKPKDWWYHQYPGALNLFCVPQQWECPQTSTSVVFQRVWSHPDPHTFIKEIFYWLAAFPSWRFCGACGLLLIGDKGLILRKGEMETGSHKSPDLIWVILSDDSRPGWSQAPEGNLDNFLESTFTDAGPWGAGTGQGLCLPGSKCSMGFLHSFSVVICLINNCLIQSWGLFLNCC